MRRRNVFLATGSALGAISLGALAIDPPFPTTVELVGSSTYNTTDWDEDNDSGDIGMNDDVNGLLFQPGAQNDAVRTQFIPGAVVEDGVTWAKFRVEIDDDDADTDDIAFYLGLYNNADDPFTTEPTQAAVFKKGQRHRSGYREGH